VRNILKLFCCVYQYTEGVGCILVCRYSVSSTPQDKLLSHKFSFCDVTSLWKTVQLAVGKTVNSKTEQLFKLKNAAKL
jgi:hypothetical protein